MSQSSLSRVLEAVDETAAALLETGVELPRVRYAFHVQGREHAFQVVRAEVEEACSTPYRAVIELSGSSWEGLQLLGASCALVLRRAEQTRCLHGIVARVVQRAGASETLQVTVVPALEALRHRIDSRIFQGKTVPEVLAEVLTPALAVHQRTQRSQLRRADYPRREYIVQYRESDLAFVQRLMAEEGIWYHFEQPSSLEDPAGETLVWLDDNEDAPVAMLGVSGAVLPLALQHGHHAYWQAVHELSEQRELGATQVTVGDVNWSHPSVPSQAAVPTDGPSERAQHHPHDVTLWAYEGERYTRHDAAEQARLRWERARGRAEHLRGCGNVIGLQPGQRVRVEGSACALDGEWIVTAVRAQGRDPRCAEPGSERADYQNVFTATRADRPLRPERLAKPRVHGIQLARVVGPDGRPESSGDDIHTDEHGRVQVKLSWDRTQPGAPNATATCYLRVAQLWSGAGWGALFLPRIGMEVLVAFVDGDPDRPLITGCVYNGLHRTPHALPDEKTRSYIRSQSSPGGRGYNELQFEDAAGKELLSLRAQRDHKIEVLHDQHVQVGHRRAERVGGDESVEIQGARTHVVHGAETLKVEQGSTRALELSGHATTRVAKDRELTVEQQDRETLLGGRKVVVKQFDQLEVAEGAHKSDHVSGQYSIVADEHFKVQQGEQQLYMKDHFYVSTEGDLQLKNPGFQLRAERDGSTVIDVGKELTIRVGNAHIRLKASGEIELVGGKEAKLGCASSSLVLEPASAKLHAKTGSLRADATLEIRGATVAIN